MAEEEMDERFSAEEHPTDLLPEYVRGEAPEAEAIRRHLAGCARCRLEAEVVGALAEGPEARLTAEERERIFLRLPRRPSPRDAWPSVAWKVAAAVALLAVGFGTWQVNRAASGGEWDPAVALRGWEEELVALGPGPEDVRLALGFPAEESGATWEELDWADPAEAVVPWEEMP